MTRSGHRLPVARLADGLRRRIPAAHLPFLGASRYPDAGYGGMFLDWALADDAPAYGNFGANGAPMRSAPVGLGWRAIRRRRNDHAEAVGRRSATIIRMRCWRPQAGWRRPVLALFRDGAGSPRGSPDAGTALRGTTSERRPPHGGAAASTCRPAGSTPAALACAPRGGGLGAGRSVLAVSLDGDARHPGLPWPGAVAGGPVRRAAGGRGGRWWPASPSDLRDVIDRFRQQLRAGVESWASIQSRCRHRGRKTGGDRARGGFHSPGRRAHLRGDGPQPPRGLPTSIPAPGEIAPMADRSMPRILIVLTSNGFARRHGRQDGASIGSR